MTLTYKKSLDAYIVVTLAMNHNHPRDFAPSSEVDSTLFSQPKHVFVHAHVHVHLKWSQILAQVSSRRHPAADN